MMACPRYQVVFQISVCLVITLSSAIALPRVARAPLEDGTEDSGLWGPWGDWSACSRSCGGGVSFQERECLIDDVDGTECIGKSKRYESCNIQECPEGSLDFRSEQCAYFNSVPYEGKYYQWVPYLGASNKCELNCMPKGQHFYYRLKETVVDGTMCNPDTLDACVEGVCEPVGCDYMLGSDAREDKCRECGGDGSTCKTIEGSFYTRRLPVGYNDILIIPAGATNIRVEERKPTNNYLALRNANSQYYINGNFSIDFPQPFSVAGTTVHYERFQNGRKRNNAPEVFRALGPTSEPLFVVLVTQEKNKGILYEYSVPANSEAATKPDTYSWIFGSYAECSQSCGGGIQFRDVSCARNSDFNIVPDYLCDTQEKPSANKTCNVDPCPPRWYLGEWSTCSKDCGSGEQVRLVYCEQLQDGTRSTMVSDDYCAKYIGVKPSYQQTCNEDPCPAWEVSTWSKCSEPCGPGIQTRQVTCSSNNIILGITCDDNERPEEEQECNLEPCQGVEWLMSDWGECSEMCGHGMQTRQIYCGSFDGLLYRDDLCEGQPKPKMMKSCTSRATCSAEWHASKWSECSAKCGEGMRSRNVMCARLVGNSWRRVPERECLNSDKFSDMEHCNNGPCEYSMWLTAPWLECSASCGGGQRERHVMCLGNGAVLPDAGCDEDMRPDLYESCNNIPCEDEEFGSGDIPDGTSTTPLATAKSALTPPVETVTSSFTTVTPPIPTTVIGCQMSQFGCCKNGIDSATGPKGRGCDRDRLEEYTCTLPRDSGDLCGDYEIKWYFDTDYSRCTQFWYGGCEGNTNRFNSEAECKSECGDDMNEMPQEDLCTQPKVIGPCKAAIPSYFYNVETGSCEHFLYGGCRGNNNRFRMGQECEIMCSTLNQDPCTLPRDPGRCSNTPVRMYYYDQSSGLCEQFFYTGCHGNPNRFGDLGSCQETCNVIGVVEESSVLEPQGSTCEEYRDSAQELARTRPGVYIPQCTLEGEYELMQCHSYTGECWCVDETGIEINGSRKAPGLQVQRPDCNAFVERLTVCQIHERNALSEASAEPLVSRYIPQCTEIGQYVEIQCYGSTGYCWCVNENGEEVEGTRTGPEEGQPDCISPEKPPCFKLRDSITSGEQTGVYIPECTPEGLFARLQCEGADECLCVNETNGDVLFPVGQAAAQGYSPQCDEAYQPDTTECQRHRSRILSENHVSTRPGQYVPQCDQEGEYEELQCYTSSGYCWCVNKNGEEIDGTRTPPGFGQPDCLNARRRVTPCHAEQEDVSNSGLLGVHYPQCTDAGLYQRIQCHTSTGYCFCANETTGESFPGSYGESRGIQPDCSDYYSQITEILPEITFAPQPSVGPTNPTSPSIKPIKETITTVPPIDFGVMTENLDDMGLITMKHERCEFSLFGCCPDGNTPSATDDFTQCPGVSEPTIDVGSGRATALQDGTVTLQCHVTGIPEPNVAWSRNGQRIDGSVDNRMYVGDDGSLTITFVQEDDAGLYDCSAYNGIGQAPEDTVELDIYTPVDIPLRGQTSVTVQEGDSAILDCLAVGNPKPTVTWTNTEDITLPNGNERMIQSDNDSLIINTIELGDAGTYICTGKNVFGTIQRKEITLIVKADVLIVTPPRDTTASKGDTIVLTCGSTGSPKPSVRWTFNGVPIRKMSHHDRFSITDNGDLTINNLKKNNAGEYICTAANGQSSLSASATVTVTKGEEGGGGDSSCVDNNELANCLLIAAAGYCQVEQYAQICCSSCSQGRR